MVSLGADGKIRVGELEAGEETLVINHRAVVYRCGVDVSPDSQWMVAGSANLTVYQGGTKKKVCVLEAAHAQGVTDVAFSPDSAQIATTATGQDGGGFDADGSRLRVWDAQSGALLHEVALAEDGRAVGGWAVRWLDDGAVVVHLDGRLVRFDLDSQTLSDLGVVARGGRVMDVHDGRIAFPVDGRVEVDGRSRSVVVGLQVLDAGTGLTVDLPFAEPLPAGRVRVTGVAWSADGTRLALGASIGAHQGVPNQSWVVVWGVEDGLELLRWELMSSEVNGLAFTPDGLGIVTADNTGELHRWAVADGDIVW